MNDIQVQIWAVLAQLWRRRWYTLGAAWLVCLIGWPLVMLIPNKYEASTRIYVDTDTLLGPLMKGMTVDVNVNQQVEVMQRTLLSKPNLESVLQTTDLALKATTPLKHDELIQQLAGHTEIRAQTRNLFTVAYTDPNPVLAKKVVQALLNIFVEGNLGTSRKDMEQARRFIDAQVAQYSAQLGAMDARIVAFKRDHFAYFSGGEITNNAATLTAANNSLAQIRGAMEDAEVRRTTLSQQIATVPQFLEVDAPAPVIVESGQKGPSPADQLVISTQQKLDQLKGQYTDEHPDVIATARQLKIVKAEADKADKEEAAKRAAALKQNKQHISNPVYEQIRLKLVDADATLDMMKQRYADQLVQVKKIDELARTAPEVEAQYADLARDYQVVKKSYDEMLARRESAKLSQEMDTKADKVQFRIIDPPQVPATPASPNRLLLMSLVLVLGIGVGVAVNFGLGQLAGAVTSVNEMRQIFMRPIIGSISMIQLPDEVQRQRKWQFGYAMACLALVIVYGGIMLLLARQGGVS